MKVSCVPNRSSAKAQQSLTLRPQTDQTVQDTSLVKSNVEENVTHDETAVQII